MRDQGGHVTVLDPASSQVGHKESIADTARVLSRIFDGIEYRGALHSTVEAARRALRRARLQRAHRPLAPDADAGRLPDDAGARGRSGRAPALRLRRRRPLQHGQLAAGHGRAHGLGRPHRGAAGAVAGRRGAGPGPRARLRSPARRSRSPRTSSPGSTGAEFVHTDIWVSMGEPEDEWAKRVALLTPYRVDASPDGPHRRPVGEVHALPAGVPRPVDVRRAQGRRRLRPASTASRSPTRCSSPPPASCSTRPRTACTPSRPILVATLS